MIFAAGFGTRMGALTADRPKPLIKVSGRTLLDHALLQAEGQAIRRIAVNAHYRAAQIVSHLKDRPDVTVLHEPELLDTGGGLRAAIPVLQDGAVFTLNSDAVWTGPNALATLRAAWEPRRMDALALLVPVDRAVGHTRNGDFRMAANGRLSRGPGLVYTGAQIINTARLADIPDRVFSFNALWDVLIAEGRLFGTVHSGGWCDVGQPESIALAEDMLHGHADV